MKQSLFLLLLTITVGAVSAKADNITFADANVKALCVGNWDTDKDGELSTEEAAAVTTLGTVFKGKTNITTFDELRYFTGVTTIGEDAFRGSSIGPTLTIPGTVKIIGDYAFNNCKSLTRIILEEGVESVGWHTFSGPISYMSLPTTLTAMSSMAVDPYGASIPQGDYFYVYTHATTPANVDDLAFYPSFAEGHLVVPPGTIDAYMSVNGWSHFGEYFELGDVNRDKELDDTDLEALISYLDGTTPETFYEDMADINGDGVVDDADVQLLRDYLQSGEGGETGIASMLHNDADSLRGKCDGYVYNMKGQVVRRDGSLQGLAKGIYIINGRKYKVIL